jgi:hypothetical protein
MFAVFGKLRGGIMTGREDRRENDLFFVCSVIEYIARKTKNRRGDVVRALGEPEIARLLDLADILHCEPLEKVAADVLARRDIAEGGFDNVALCKYSVPTHFDIGKVYKRLVVNVADKQKITFLAALIQAYTSWISEKIDNYNSSMYFESPQYLFESYLAGEPL